MHFKFTSALGLLAAITPALAGVPQLQEFAEGSVNVRDIFDKVTPVTMFTNVPQGINEYKDRIISLKSETIQKFPNGFGKDQPAICEDFVNYATKSTDLMNALITKYGLLSITPFGQPVAAILRLDEGLTDTLTYNVKGIVPDCKAQIEDAEKKMSDAYKKAVDTYSQ